MNCTIYVQESNEMWSHVYTYMEGQKNSMEEVLDKLYEEFDDHFIIVPLKDVTDNGKDS